MTEIKPAAGESDYARKLAELLVGLNSNSSLEDLQSGIRICVTFLGLKAGEKVFYNTLKYSGGGPNIVKFRCDPKKLSVPPLPQDPVIDLAAYALSLESRYED